MRLLVVLLVVAVATTEASFWTSEFSTTDFATFNFRNKFNVAIFKHQNKNNTFYLTPLVLLLHRSGRLRHSKVTGLHELRFQVVLFNNELKLSVLDFLTKRGYRDAELKMLPMEKIRFAWRTRMRQMLKGVQLETAFISTHHLPQTITLLFACKERTQCQNMLEEVTVAPEVLDTLELDCFLTSQKSAIKKIKVTITNLMDSKTFSEFMHLPPDGNYRYIRSDDFNQLAQETFSSVKASTIRSSAYVDKSDEINIVGLIERALRQDEIATTALRETQWSSVFWNPMFARPDRVVHEAKKVFQFNSTTGRLDVNQQALTSSADARRLFYGNSDYSSGSFDTWLVSGSSSSGSSTTLDTSSSSSSLSSNSFSKNELNDLLQRKELDVQWDGEKFTVRPMRLVRVNTRSLRSRREFVSESVQMTLYEHARSFRLRVTGEHNQTADAEIQSQPSCGFPVDQKFCLLSNGGSCPPGFKRSSGHIKAINIDTSTSNAILQSSLGDSTIGCHSPPDRPNDCSFTAWDPYKAEIRLVVCCR